MMKRVFFLLCVALCALCASAMAETVSLTTVVPEEHSVVVRIGEHGSVRYGDTYFSDTAAIAVQRFDSAQITILPDQGYELGEVRVSSGENIQVVGMEIQISSAVEDLIVELAFEKAAEEVEWGPPVYVWSDDNTSVTATRISIDDAGLVETETVTASGEITRAATCETNGETIYTSAAFANANFEVQTKTVADIPALGHDWGEFTGVWNETDGIVTLTRTCQRNVAHVERKTLRAVLALPAGLTAIEPEAFMGDTAIEAVIIPDGCTSIGSKAFANCPNLAYVRIPASVASIPEDAFAGSDQVVIERAE